MKTVKLQENKFRSLVKKLIAEAVAVQDVLSAIETMDPDDLTTIEKAVKERMAPVRGRQGVLPRVATRK
jgi:hypothetical protein